MISNEQQAFYRDNGYLIVEGVLSPARLCVRDALEDRLVFEGPQAGWEGAESPGVRRLCNLFAKARAFEELAVEPIVLEMARLTIGPAVRWHGMNFHDPIPGDLAAHQPIHTDRSFEPNCTGFLNVCWAIDAMTEENGATRIVPGSHKRGCLPRDLLSEEQTRAPIEGEIYAVCTAGSAVFVHGDTWHSGRVNRSSATRRAIHLTFACPNTAPHYEIARSMTPEIRTRLGTNCELIPDNMDAFGLPDYPRAGRMGDNIRDSADTDAWKSGDVQRG